MRNPIVIQQRSAMDKKQKYGILSQELVRRLSNISEGGEGEQEEKLRVVEAYTRQLKQSGYNHRETEEIIQSGYLGMKRKRERRKKLGLPLHREGGKTVVARARKKLLEKRMWYRKEKEEEESIMDRKGQKINKRNKRSKVKEKEKETVEIKSVIFIQQTKDSKLVKWLREAEEKLGETTKYRIKFVEKVGEKLVDILCQSNPWKGNQCNREQCLLCDTKEETGKGKRQSCSTRNITYETWCGTCEDREKEKMEKERIEEENTTVGEKERKRRSVTTRKEMRKHKYVGETGRSAYERGKEHQRDREKWDKGSHMLKHIVLAHEGEEETEIKFRMRIVKTHRSAFERQVFEGIRIQNERQIHDILNSKTEYNRCALPRLEVNIGNVKKTDRDKERKEEERKELEIEKKIEDMKKTRSTQRVVIVGIAREETEGTDKGIEETTSNRERKETDTLNKGENNKERIKRKREEDGENRKEGKKMWKSSRFRKG